MSDPVWEILKQQKLIFGRTVHADRLSDIEDSLKSETPGGDHTYQEIIVEFTDDQQQTSVARAIAKAVDASCGRNDGYIFHRLEKISTEWVATEALKEARKKAFRYRLQQKLVELAQENHCKYDLTTGALSLEPDSAYYHMPELVEEIRNILLNKKNLIMKAFTGWINSPDYRERNSYFFKGLDDWYIRNHNGQPSIDMDSFPVTSDAEEDDLIYGKIAKQIPGRVIYFTDKLDLEQKYQVSD